MTPLVSVDISDGLARVEAHMKNDELTQSTTAYELYYQDSLVGFSRTGIFEYQCEGDEDPADFSVISYDVRLNPSEPGRANDMPFGVAVPSMTIGDDGNYSLDIDGPQGATYSYSVSDDSILEVNDQDVITPKAAGSTSIFITMHKDGKNQGPFEVFVSIDPRKITVEVDGAQITVGDEMPNPEVRVIEGSSLEGDSLGEATYYALDDSGAQADLLQPGTYALYVSYENISNNYELTVVPGSLSVVPAESGGDTGDGDGDNTNGSNPDGGNDTEGDENGNGAGTDGDNDDTNAGNNGTNNNGGVNTGNGGTNTGNNSGGVGTGNNSTHTNNGNTGNNTNSKNSNTPNVSSANGEETNAVESHAAQSDSIDAIDDSSDVSPEAENDTLKDGVSATENGDETKGSAMPIIVGAGVAACAIAAAAYALIRRRNLK